MRPRKPLIEVAGKINKTRTVPKDKEEVVQNVPVEEELTYGQPPKIANISHIYNHKLLDQYEKYFNDEDLVTDINAQQESARKAMAFFVLKLYRLIFGEDQIPILEIEIYSHDDYYKDLLLWSYMKDKNPQAKDLDSILFHINATNKIKGSFLIKITAVEKEGKIIEGPREVFDALKDNYKITPPSKEETDNHEFDSKEYLFTGPRRELDFLSCVKLDDLNHASKNIMAPRSYSLNASVFVDERKMLYAYQSMRNNEGTATVSSNLKIKPQKLSAWMRRFYKIPEIKNPSSFAKKEFDWSNFEEYLKAFKYFTQLN